MSSTISSSIETVVAEPESGNLSESIKSTQDVEKNGLDDVDVEVELPEASKENVTACLQVVGAFFLMFNSWYVGFHLYIP
jgi:hypothetical protein